MVQSMSKVETMTPPNGLLQISESEFLDIAQLVYDRFGINLTQKKKALVRGRLNSLIRSCGYNSFGEYYESIRADRTGQKLLSLVDRISTNHSYFFREADHFEHVLTSALPEIEEQMRRRGAKDLRIWSAGCAAGEEAYTLAMVLSEYARERKPSWNIEILATDISTSVLEQAKGGIYPDTKLAAMPERYRKYFSKHNSGSLELSDSIKKLVLFRRLNLMRDDFPFKDKFDMIFCRNVMIYFDQQTKTDLVKRFARYTHKGGFLYIGHSETLGRNPESYRYVKPTVYQL